jgi:hypothetical protein
MNWTHELLVVWEFLSSLQRDLTVPSTFNVIAWHVIPVILRLLCAYESPVDLIKMKIMVLKVWNGEF